MKRTKLNIYSYLNYRMFLAHRLVELKKESSKYSQRFFARRLGLSTNNYLKRIADGERNLSDKLARKVAEVIGLNQGESGFFLDLVRFNQAKTTESKTDALESLRKNKRFVKVHQLELDQFDYFSDPLTLTMRDLVGLEDFNEDPKWIAGKLQEKVRPKAIRESLAKLERLGQLKRDRDGILQVTHAHQSTGPQLGSQPLRQYHLNMLAMAAQSMELPTDTRHFRGLTMSIPTKSYEQIVEELSLCINKVRAIIDASKDSEHVYHLEMGFFPLTKRKSSD